MRGTPADPKRRQVRLSWAAGTGVRRSQGDRSVPPLYTPEYRERCREALDEALATVAIDTMEKHGWVRREPDPETRKRVCVVATDTGLAKLAEVEAAHKAIQPARDPLSCLSGSEREALGSMLCRIREHIRTFDRPDNHVDRQGPAISR